MSALGVKVYGFLADPRKVRWVVFLLALAGVAGSLAGPELVEAGPGHDGGF